MLSEAAKQILMLEDEAKALTLPEQGTVSWYLIKSDLRFAHIVKARRAVCVRLKELGWSYPAIGVVMGRDHTTIMALVGAKKRRPTKPVEE